MTAISVITVTLNAAIFLPGLIESLENQTDPDFIWIVKDGLSSDGSMLLAQTAKLKKTQLLETKDFSLYDALNQAVSVCETDYYLVVGADDMLDTNAIREFKKAINLSNNASFISAAVVMDGNKVVSKKTMSWKYGGNTYVASHAVGCLIKTQLHQSVGFYSNKFPACADMFFILSSLKAGASLAYIENFVSGEFGTGGLSSIDRALSLTDFYRIQIKFGRSKLVQLILLAYRLLKLTLSSKTKR
jgi:glycosyltransferase involved in cell wall biosynthesis